MTKLFPLAAAALSLVLLSPAQAGGQQFPAGMLGTWCGGNGSVVYGRESNCLEDKLIVTPVGFVGRPGLDNEFVCRITSKTMIPEGKLLASFKFVANCTAEDGKFVWRGKIGYRGEIGGGGTLFLSDNERMP
jgi:hypothetical protein